MYSEIKACRICHNRDLVSILSLGEQALTGIFPPNKETNIEFMPLDLCKCNDETNPEACGLVQLRHSGDSNAMYGENYGYRSGLNASMVRHLQSKVKKMLTTVSVGSGDVVIDIGSNDSTLLQSYPKNGARLVGIDPTGIKFKSYYPAHIELIPTFFSKSAFEKSFGATSKAKIISSISMFYDLENPVQFMKDIFDVLAPDGVWVLEQSYLPTMLKTLAYDTICHEHLEYYALKQIKWMADRVGFKIIDLEFNAINGGSFSLALAKKDSVYSEATQIVADTLKKENELGLHTMRPYNEFKVGIESHTKQLLAFFAEQSKLGKKVFGYGASTKGNVILQHCKITSQQMPCIAEVNENKFGCYTPGTKIPIVSEAAAKKQNPDYFLVLPWHFRDNIVEREGEFLKSGGKLVFPLPELQVVSG